MQSSPLQTLTRLALTSGALALFALGAHAQAPGAGGQDPGGTPGTGEVGAPPADLPLPGLGEPGAGTPELPGALPPGLPAGSGPVGLTLFGRFTDVTEWDAWWRLNQHDYLRLKEHVWRLDTTSGDAAYNIGVGQRAEQPTSLRPTDEDRAARVAPALRRLLSAERSPATLAAGLLALAKLGEQPGAEGEPASAAAILAWLPSSNQQVREAAVLALGVLGEPQWLDELASVAAADARGVELVGGELMPARTRAFAAYGMGLLAQRSGRVDVQRYVAHELVRRLEARERGTYDLPVACLNALGALQLPARPERVEGLADEPPGSSREALAVWLLERLESSRLPERVRAHVPRALARQLDPHDDPLKERAVAALLEQVAHGRRDVQYGAIQALGELGTAGSRPVDVRVRRGLMDAVERGDSNARHLALIALAEVGARPHFGSPEPIAGMEPVRALLVEQLERSQGRTRPWAAIALGVHGFRTLEAGLPLSSSTSAALLRAFERERNPFDTGALALAIALRGDLSATAVLLERMDELGDPVARGYVAQALGLLGEREAGTALRELLEESSQRPELLRSAAIGLALLGDRGLVPELVERMQAAAGEYERAAHAWALGRSGDARALEPTIAVMLGPDAQPLARQAAAEALGWMAEPELLPWNAALARDANQLAAPPSLTDPLGGGVCDLP